MSIKQTSISWLESHNILIRNGSKYEAIPKGNPAAIRIMRSFVQLARTTILPSLPELSNESLKYLVELIGLPPAQALYLLDCLRKSMRVPGVICEMGVAQGATSRLLAHEIRNSDRSIWLFDSFKGLPKPSQEDDLINDLIGLGAMASYEGKMKCPRDLVE